MASMICKLNNMEDYLTYFVRSFPNSVDITKSYWSVITDSYPAVCCFVLSKSLQSLWISLTRERASKNVCKKQIRTLTVHVQLQTEHVDSILLCICSVVIDHRWCKNVVRTRKWLTRPSQVCHWCMHTLACYRLHKLNKMKMLQTSEMGPFRVPFRAWTSSGFNWNLEMNASATVSFICILWLRD